jgi:hypothetical protein
MVEALLMVEVLDWVVQDIFMVVAVVRIQEVLLQATQQ